VEISSSGLNRNIQKDYDYGVPRGEAHLKVYRITRVDKLGQVSEFTWSGIEDFCDEYELDHVPVHFSGKAKDLFKIEGDFTKEFLDKLKETYFKDVCEFCTTGVCSEGVVVKINSKPGRPAFKFKNPTFLVKESASRDKGEVDMEEQEG